MTDARTIDLAAVRAAREAIAGHVLRTPLVPSPALSKRAGAPVHLKLEQLQITGSFKLRGATNALLGLPDEARRRGVVAVSTGNHGRAVAHAAKALNMRAAVLMSRLVPRNKVEAIAALGAEVRIAGDSQDEAEATVEALIADEGLSYIPPFDHAGVIAGQGTLGLEIIEELPDVAAIVVPLSGGGLIGGIALAAKAAKPGVRIVGVSMRRGAAMHASLEAGRPVPVTEEPTLADSLGGGIGLHNRHTFALVRDLVDEVVLLDEDEIAAGIRHAYRVEGIVLEGGGAVAIAAILAGRLGLGGVTALLLSGRNIDMNVHHRLVAEAGAAEA